ncbi:hypothetical protein EI94DRAFT_504957 [Lactarius quietus]|nr:hypothetical protein EI94DRAFT_504957 [Lactarius quietus]
MRLSGSLCFSLSTFSSKDHPTLVIGTLQLVELLLSMIPVRRTISFFYHAERSASTEMSLADLQPLKPSFPLQISPQMPAKPCIEAQRPKWKVENRLCVTLNLASCASRVLS